MKKFGIKLDAELYEEFQRIYDESIDRDVDMERKGTIEENRKFKGR